MKITSNKLQVREELSFQLTSVVTMTNLVFNWYLTQGAPLSLASCVKQVSIPVNLRKE